MTLLNWCRNLFKTDPAELERLRYHTDPADRHPGDEPDEHRWRKVPRHFTAAASDKL